MAGKDADAAADEFDRGALVDIHLPSGSAQKSSHE
jgi:hypothetical protein